MNLEITRLMVKKILEHANAYEWSLQGFGMFRMYLSKKVRLHVWDDRYKVPNVTTIHTHPWHFHSMVISGRILNRIYCHSGDKTQPPTHMSQLIVCGEGGGVEPCKPEPVDLRLIKVQHITIEQSYRQDAHEIHESSYVNGTVTLVEREHLSDEDHAHVFYPYGQKWVSAEPREALCTEVDRMAELALTLL